MPRIARVVVVGLPHHVTQRGNNRERVFFDDDDRRHYLWTLLEYRQRCGVSILGYCLMDNHVHVLAVPGQEDSLARCFAGANLLHTQRANRRHGRSGRLWQNRFFSCPVQSDSYLLAALRYIESNPVRAGLVERAWDYRWSSARHHVLSEPDPLVSDPGGLLGELGRDYRRLLRETGEEGHDDIRRATATGRPLGGPVFVAALESRLGRRLESRGKGRPRTRKRR